MRKLTQSCAFFFSALTLLIGSSPLFAETLSFQDGILPTPSYTGTRDTFLKQTKPTTAYGANTTLQADGAGDGSEPLLKWDIRAIPPGSTVMDASISISVSNSSSQVYEIYEIKRDWSEATATWNAYAAGSSWQTPGAQGINDRGTTVLGTMSGGAGQKTFSFNASGIARIQAWVDNPATNFGIIVADLSNSNGFDFQSREQATPGNRPKLTVTYFPPGVIPPPTSSISFHDGLLPTPGYAGTRDTYLKQSKPNQAFGSSNTLSTDGGSGTGEEPIVKWDIRTIPPGSTVTDASISVSVSNSSSQIYEIYEMKRDWNEASATWNAYAAGISWQTPGAQGISDRGTTVLGTMSGNTGRQTFSFNSSGVARVQAWVNNPATNFGIIVTDLSNNNGFDFRSREYSTLNDRPRLNVTYIPPVKLGFIIQPSNTTAGSSLFPALQIAIQDANGNTMTSSTASVTVAIGTNPGGGTLSGTLTVAAVNGIATFPNLAIDKAGTGYTLTAASTGLAGATSATFNITTASASKLAYIVQPSDTIVGVTISPFPQIAVQDNFGNTVTRSTASITVAIGTNPGGGTLSGTLTVAAVNGIADFTDLSIDKPAVGYTLIAVATGLTSTTSTPFNVTTAISGRVWADANHNGALEGGESGIAGVTVQLYTMPANTLQATITTLADGSYRFTGVTDGNYEVRETNPAGVISITPDIWVVTVSGMAVANQNFGDFEGVKISGRVFYDTGAGGGTPHNGIQEGSENGIVGISVRVTDAADTILYDQTVTDFSGVYTLWVTTSVSMPVVVREQNPANVLSITPDTLALDIVPGDNLAGNNFADVPPLLFFPNGSQTVHPGGMVTYAHTLTAGTAGSVELIATSSQTLVWTFYKDLNGNSLLDAGEPLLTPADLDLAANQTVMILAWAFIPSNLPWGTVDITTITATQALVNSTLTDTRSVTNVTLVQGTLQLTKIGSVTIAKPGDTVDYTLTYKNIGTETVNDIVLYDQLSEYVDFVSAIPPPDPSFPDATGLLRWTIPGILAGGDEGAISYTIHVK